MNKDFLNPNNIKLIYDTLYDLNYNNIQYIVREKNEKKLEELKNFIMENIQTYNKDNNKEKKTLIETNKNFMMFLYNDIEINERNIKKNKPTIMNTLTNNIYETRNHIEEKNKQEFTSKLKNKQKEFENEINIIIPPTPNFKDETYEKPLKNIDLNQLILERKNEIEKIIQNEYKQEIQYFDEETEKQDFKKSQDFFGEENKQKIKISTTDINILEDIETFDETSNSLLKKFKLNDKFDNDKFDNITYEIKEITKFKEIKIEEYQKQLDFYFNKKIKEYQEQLDFYFDKKIKEYQIKKNMKNEYLSNDETQEE